MHGNNKIPNHQRNKLELEGRLALVTGAAGSIGSAIVNELCDAGAKVVALDLDFSNFKGFSECAEANTERYKLDLSDLDGVYAFCEEYLKANRGIDILINNAGILTNNKLQDTTIEELHHVSKINMDSAFIITQKFIPHMQKNGWGRVINVSSFAWKAGGKTAGTSYCVSKAAMIGFTFTVAREVAQCGVTVNAIAPAYVMSPMVSAQLSEEQRHQQLLEIPVGRFCTADEVAHTIMFLASPRAGFITGEVVDMNGGMQFD